MEKEIVSEHFLLPQPYREDYHPDKSRPKGGAIPCENAAILLQSADLKPKDSDVGKGRVLKTVRRKFEGWTRREVKETKLARTMALLKLKQMVSVNGLKNVPICPEHVTNATRMFGPNTAALEDKTVRRPSPRVHEDGGGEHS